MHTSSILYTVPTKDGSLTVFNQALGVHYHSIHGALQESQHIFIQNGLKQLTHLPQVRILEVGFGTGLNTLLSYTGKKDNQNIIYTSLDIYTISSDLIDEIKESYGNSLLFESLHAQPWNIRIQWQHGFTLTKKQIGLLDFTSSEHFDLCYFDAFAPEVQPELWTEEVFHKLYNQMTENGLLVTYCAKGDVKRAMRNAGFSVHRLQGPPGKRHMIRAIKQKHAG